ncbi:unnamed protein product [Rangifer tarandus platyrhynchus]|uniref:Uncharacterized protein n=1 Tax=Rangifer tarandus platyrhynchus TaxID=3082113 RepID=A0AC59YBP0_RANTA
MFPESPCRRSGGPAFSGLFKSGGRSASCLLAGSAPSRADALGWLVFTGGEHGVSVSSAVLSEDRVLSPRPTPPQSSERLPPRMALVPGPVLARVALGTGVLQPGVCVEAAAPQREDTLVEKSAVSWLCGVGGNRGRKPRAQPGTGRGTGPPGTGAQTLEAQSPAGGRARAAG